MTLYLQLLFLNFLLVFGIWKLFQKEEVFGSIGDWLYNRLGEYWSKPLFNCPSCMASVYGTIFFVAAYHVMPAWVQWWMWPLHCLALCGAATVVTFLDHE